MMKTLKDNNKKKHSLRSRLLLSVLIIHFILNSAALMLCGSRMIQITDYFVERHIAGRLQGISRLVYESGERYVTLAQGVCSNQFFLEGVRMFADAGGIAGVPDEVIVYTQEHLKNLSNSSEDLCGMMLIVNEQPVAVYNNLPEEKTGAWMKRISGLTETDPDTDISALEPAGENAAGPYFFQVKQKIHDPDQPNRIIGTIVLCVRGEAFNTALHHLEEGEMFAIESNGYIAACPNAAYVGHKAQENKTRISDGEYASWYVEKLHNDEIGCDLTMAVSMRNYDEALSFTYSMLTVAGVLGSVLMLLALWYAYKPILGYVQRLIAAINRIRVGDLTVRMGDDTVTEILELDDISDKFNEMMDSANRLVEQRDRNWEERKQAEIQALEAQINPHFVYNSLDAINWKAIENEEYEISGMITDLADIMRYTIRSAGEETTLREELDWLTRYVRFQQNKLGKTICLETQIGSELLDTRLYKLLLQPLVENSIRSMAGVDREPHLRISAAAEGSDIVIRIFNTGKKIPPEQLAELNDISYHKEGHFGIENLRKRLQLYYGDNSSLVFRSEEDGTETVLTILFARM